MSENFIYLSYCSSFLKFANTTLDTFQKIKELDYEILLLQKRFLNPICKKLVNENSTNNKHLNLSKLSSQNSYKNEILNKRSKSNANPINYFKIHFCNTRSIYNKLNLITTHLNTENVDIIFFTETWLSKNISDSMICPNGYGLIRKDRLISRGGGVCMFFKSHLKVIEIERNNENCGLDENFDYLCVDVHDGKLIIRFFCIYIPPSSSRNVEVINYICKIISKLSSSSKPFYLIGDFNLPLINWAIPKSDGDSAHDAFLNFCLSHNYHQFIDQPTHQKGNILDLLLCNTSAKYQLLNYNVNPPLTSTCDHNLISFQIQRTSNSLPNQTPIQFPNFSKANYTKIYEELISTNWNDVINPTLSLQQNYDNFLEILHSKINTYIPKVTSRPGTSMRKPYHIRQLLKRKQKIYKKCKQHPSYKSKFTEISKKYEAAVKEWHNNMEVNLCNKPSSKKFFKYVKKKLKSQAPIPPIYDDHEQLVLSDSEKANMFNQFFQSVFTMDNGNPLDLTPKHLTEMMNPEITYVEILDAVHDSKDKISRTPDNVPIYFIKRVIGPILQPLIYLFNSFLNQGFVPWQWKMARVIPVFKKGNRNKVQNYRPISLTSSFCRLFESIISKRILNHLQLNSLLTPKQFGFLPNKSTSSNLFTCYHKWLVAFSSNQVTNVVYTDISKAFDTVSHPKLISVLKNYGLNNSIITWIKNFLANRQQQVSIGNTLSKLLPVWSGVPQGSVLGPLLFIIYINDIKNCSQILHPVGDLSLFADDAKFFCTDENLLQSSLDLLTSWTQSRQLNLAEKKCKTLEICKPSKRQSTKFILNNHELTSTSNIKDLGIYISSDLKWADQISFIYNKASVVSYQILKTFQTNNFSTFIKLYSTYIRPILEHNTSLWSPWLKKDILKLESVQRNYTRRIFMRCGISFFSYTDRLSKANLKSLQYRRSTFDLHLLYKIINNFTDLKFQNYFHFRTTNYNIRGKSTKIYPKHHFNDPQWTNSFFVRSTRLWNLLPDYICCAKSLSEFKTKLNKFDLTPYIHQFLD